VGKRRIPDSPRMIDGRYWKLLIWLSLSFGEFGFGPCGFGPTPSPLAVTQAMSPPLETCAATGYAAVGTRPTSRHARARRLAAAPHVVPDFPGKAKTAIASSPESAASR